MAKKRILIFFHGFLSPTGKTSFHKFTTLFGSKENFDEIVDIPYFVPEDPSTYKHKLWIQKGIDLVKQYDKPENEIILIGFSSGAILVTEVGKHFPNIKKYIFLSAVWKIHLADWYGKLFKTWRKYRNLKKRLSPERFQRLVSREAAEGTHKHPVLLSRAINNFRKRYRRSLRKIENVEVLWMKARLDDVVHLDKCDKYIKKHLPSSSTSIQKVYQMTHNNGMSTEPIKLWGPDVVKFAKGEPIEDLEKTN